MQNWYGQHAAEAAQFFSYMFSEREIMHHKDVSAVMLNDSNERESVINRINELLEEQQIAEVIDEEKSKIITTAVKEYYLSGGVIDKYTDAAWGIIVNTNMVDLIARHYYQKYTEYRPMRELLNQLAKVTPLGISTLFGDDLPVKMRRCWPQFSSLFESNRANSGFLKIDQTDHI